MSVLRVSREWAHAAEKSIDVRVMIARTLNRHR